MAVLLKVLGAILTASYIFQPARWERLGCYWQTVHPPHSGKGEDCLTGQLNFFTETAVTPERKHKKSFPRSEINHHAEG